jgi:hypothetical protein
MELQLSRKQLLLSATDIKTLGKTVSQKQE